MTLRPAPDSLYGLTTLQTCLYFQKSWKSGLCMSAKKTLDLEPRVQVIEICSNHAQSGSRLKRLPDDFVVV